MKKTVGLEEDYVNEMKITKTNENTKHVKQ